MAFDPLFNYETLNLQEPKNLAYYRFAEIIKGLVTLSSGAERQQEIIGIGEAAAEMAEDFNGHLYLGTPLFTEYQLADTVLLEKLQQLADFMYTHGPSDNFWDKESLYHHPGWEKVRTDAREILIGMGYSHLTLVISREEFYKEMAGKQYLTGQRTRLRLQ